MRVSEYIIFAFCFIFALKIVTRVWVRLSDCIRISRLKKIGASVKFRRFPLASLVFPSKSADVTVTLGDAIYLVRFINGRSSNTYLHFASRDYFVTYKKHMLIPSLRRKGGGKRLSDTTVWRGKVSILPTLDGKALTAYPENKKVAEALIVSPIPQEVTYVSETKTSIRLAFTGDEFYGKRIFTAQSFVRYADREKRKSERLGSELTMK